MGAVGYFRNNRQARASQRSESWSRFRELSCASPDAFRSCSASAFGSRFPCPRKHETSNVDSREKNTGSLTMLWRHWSEPAAARSLGSETAPEVTSARTKFWPDQELVVTKPNENA